MANLLSTLSVYLRLAWAILRRRPYKLSLLVSKGCNLRCQICSLWQNENVTLQLAEVQRIWGAFRAKPCWVNVSGGEPMLNRELEAILGWFVEMDRPRLVTVTTNGFVDCAPLVRRVLRRNRRSLLYVSVSLDGNEAVHDEARGRARSFQRAFATYQRLREMQREFPALKVGISTTISRVNQARLLPFVLQTLEHCPELTVNLAQGSEYYQNAAADGFQDLSAGELVPLLASIQRALARFSLDSLLKVNYLEMAIRYLQGGYRPIPCTSYLHNVLVTSELDVVDCTVRFRPWPGAGRSRTDKLEQVCATIAGPAERTTAIRDEVRRSGCEQGCHTPCEKYVHSIAALLHPRYAPRLLWAYLRTLALRGAHRGARSAAGAGEFALEPAAEPQRPTGVADVA
jgi:uncharacterized Fe-S cluster-containing radical SAM superfamily protein